MSASPSPPMGAELRALRRSRRGQRVLLGGLLVATLAGAAWSFTRPDDRGNEENPAKVLVALRGEPKGYATMLRDLGFDVAERSLPDLEVEARDLAGSNTATVEAIAKYADRFGFGFVVFEAPQLLDFTVLGRDVVLPPFGDDTRFAAVSVGDLADPVTISVNPPPSAATPDRATSLLQALFAQPRLAALHTDNENPTLAEIKLRDQLRKALTRLERIPKAVRTAERVLEEFRAALEDEERASVKPARLSALGESARVEPLATGEVLSIHHPFRVLSPDGVTAKVEFGKRDQFSVHPEGQPTVQQRRECLALAAGGLDMADSPRYVVSRDGRVVLVRTLSEGSVLWRAEDHADPMCHFVRLGSVPPLRVSTGLGVPNGLGAVAGGGAADGKAVVEVVTTSASTSELIGHVPQYVFGEVVWGGDDIIFVEGRSEIDDTDAVFVVARSHPDRALRLDTNLDPTLGPLHGFDLVQRGPDEVGVVAAIGTPSRLYLLELPSSWKQDLMRARFASSPTVVEVVARPLSVEGSARNPVVSPDGRWVAFVIDDAGIDAAAGDTEIAIVPSSPADGHVPLQLLTRNAVADEQPRWLRDSSAVVFATRLRIPRTKWMVTVGRLARVEAPTPTLTPPTSD